MGILRIWVAGLLLALFGGGVMAGCGGSGGSTGTTETTTPTEVSSGQGSVTAGVAAIKTSLLSSTLRAGGESSILMSASAATSADIDNCIESSDGESGDGFSVICICTVNGAASGTITTVFDSGWVEGSCQQSDGTSGTILGVSGSVTVSFDGCALEGCGESLTLDGSLQGTIEYNINGCTSAETLEASVETESACSGLVITHENASTDTVGFSATWSTGANGDVQSGSACINGEAADLEGLDAVCDEQAQDSCSEATVACVSDFACQLFADNSPDDAFNTDNVACVVGCCVVSETGRCSDGEDNDFDGVIDCSDSDCLEDPYCVVGPCGSGTVSCSNDFACQVFAESDSSDQFTTSNVSCVDSCCIVATLFETGQCADSTDNDSDGAADCADSDCAGDLACGARLPCRNIWQCASLVAGTAMAGAEPTCITYPVNHSYYRYNDGSCEYNCNTAASPADCVNTCIPMARTMQNGGFLNNVDKICRFYPPPH